MQFVYKPRHQDNASVCHTYWPQRYLLFPFYFRNPHFICFTPELGDLVSFQQESLHDAQLLIKYFATRTRAVYRLKCHHMLCEHFVLLITYVVIYVRLGGISPQLSILSPLAVASVPAHGDTLQLVS